MTASRAWGGLTAARASPTRMAGTPRRPTAMPSPGHPERLGMEHACGCTHASARYVNAFVHRSSSRLAKWYGAKLIVADHFYPSTRRGKRVRRRRREARAERAQFHCSRCGHEADRDVNAAANLASYPSVAPSGDWPRVAAKHAETQNACGEGSAGARHRVVRETRLDEPGRASAQRPRRAVSTKSVNTL